MAAKKNVNVINNRPVDRWNGEGLGTSLLDNKQIFSLSQDAQQIAQVDVKYSKFVTHVCFAQAENRNSSSVRYWIDIDNLSCVNYFELLFFLTREKVFSRRVLDTSTAAAPK